MSKFPGIGVMIQQLGGNKDSIEAFRGAVGKKITDLSLGEDDALHFTFEDGYRMKLSDEGQSCCESRYMRTDDKLEDYIGGTLTDAEVREAPNVEDEYGEHEVQFLVVRTSKGDFTMSSHNEHNGYYGGFYIKASVE